MTERPFDAQPFGLIAASIAKAALSRQTRTMLERGDSPRSGQPVWRNSYTVGQIEDRIWKPINGGSKRGGRRWTRAILDAAEKLEIRTLAQRREKDPGARNGALGEVGLRVLKYLYEVVDYATGELQPAIRTIAEATGRAYSAVHRALVRLRQHGFLQWMRRSKPVDNPEPGGQQVEQASNAYALLVPEGMRSWLARLIGKGPTPECEQERAQRRHEDLQRMLAGLTASEFHRQPFNEGALFGPTLRDIAAGVDAREAKKGESFSSDETGGSF